MSHFIRDNITKVDRRPIPPGASEVNFVTATDLNDIQDWIRGGDWYGLAAQAADPVPSGVTNYIWLKTDGTLWKTVNSVATQIGAGGGITNGAGANVIPKSDGTNLTTSNLSESGSTLTYAGAVTVNTDGDALTISGKMGGGAGDNIWVGNPPAGTVTTAFMCTALGAGALASNLTAGHAVAIGANAFTNLNGNTLTDSVAVGARAGQATTTGGDLTLVGYRAGEANTTGNSNTIIGSETFLVNTTGSQNVGVGAAVLASNSTASNNVAVGQSAMSANTTGANNVAVGHSALAAQTTGATNIAIGYQAMNAGVTTGNNNIGIGQNALNAMTSGVDNVGIGRSVLAVQTTANNNTAVGALALNANTSGFVNVGVGHSALTACTQGAANVAVGRNALLGVTTGNFNTAIGDQAGGGITTGSNNTIIGAQVTGLTAGLANNILIADGAGTVRLFMGRTGSPEGVVAAAIGSLYVRADGGANTTLYVKESGAGTNTGWVAK